MQVRYQAALRPERRRSISETLKFYNLQTHLRSKSPSVSLFHRANGVHSATVPYAGMQRRDSAQHALPALNTAVPTVCTRTSGWSLMARPNCDFLSEISKRSQPQQRKELHKPLRVRHKRTTMID